MVGLDPTISGPWGANADGAILGCLRSQKVVGSGTTKLSHPGNDLPAFAFCEDENPAGGANARATPLIRGCDAQSAYV